MIYEMKILAKGKKWFKAVYVETLFRAPYYTVYNVEINEVSKTWVVDDVVSFFAKTSVKGNEYGKVVTFYPTLDRDIIDEQIRDGVETQIEFIENYIEEKGFWYKKGETRILKTFETLDEFDRLDTYKRVVLGYLEILKKKSEEACKIMKEREEKGYLKYLEDKIKKIDESGEFEKGNKSKSEIAELERNRDILKSLKAKYKDDEQVN